MHLAIPALFLAAAQAVPFTLDRLELDLRVDHANARVEGTARLGVRNASTAPAREVPLLLNRLMTVTDAGGLPFSQGVLTFEDDSWLQVDAVRVRLPETLAPGASTTITLAYGGHIAPYEETGRLYVKDRVSEDYTIVREDAYSFPVLGVPSLARNRTHPAGRLHVRRARDRRRAGFVVAAGGFAGRVETGAGTTFRFASRREAPFLNLCVARFRTLEGKGFTLSYLPADEAGAKRIFRRTEEALALLDGWFGPPPRAPTLAIVEIPSGWGSQAHRISGIILAAESFHDPTQALRALPRARAPLESARPRPPFAAVERRAEHVAAAGRRREARRAEAVPGAHGRGASSSSSDERMKTRAIRRPTEPRG